MKNIAVYAPDTIPLQGYGGADAPIYPNIAVLKKNQDIRHKSFGRGVEYRY